MADDERIDGRHLITLDEPGSDDLLDDDARERIRERMERDGLEAHFAREDEAPATLRERIRERRERRREARDHPEADPTAIDPDEPTG